jgi:restriction endonuclease Mrr
MEDAKLLIRKCCYCHLFSDVCLVLHVVGKINHFCKEKIQCIRQKTGAQNIVKEIKQYQKKWLQHVQRRDINRLPNQALQYKPKGRKEHRTTEEEMEGPTSS